MTIRSSISSGNDSLSMLPIALISPGVATLHMENK